eukprot:SAG31_NODE_2392_length_5797_cov_6.901369_1_plen_149_part_00
MQRLHRHARALFDSAPVSNAEERKLSVWESEAGRAMSMGSLDPTSLPRQLLVELMRPRCNPGAETETETQLAIIGAQPPRCSDGTGARTSLALNLAACLSLLLIPAYPCLSLSLLIPAAARSALTLLPRCRAAGPDRAGRPAHRRRHR